MFLKTNTIKYRLVFLLHLDVSYIKHLNSLRLIALLVLQIIDSPQLSYGI